MLTIKKEKDNLVHCSVAIDKLRRMGEHADIAYNTTGSKLLQPVSEYLGFSLDQVGASAPEIYFRVQYFLTDVVWLTLIRSYIFFCQLTLCHFLRDMQ